MLLHHINLCITTKLGFNIQDQLNTACYLPKRVPSYSDTATQGDCWCLAPSPVTEDLHRNKHKSVSVIKLDLY